MNKIEKQELKIDLEKLFSEYEAEVEKVGGQKEADRLLVKHGFSDTGILISLLHEIVGWNSIRKMKKKDRIKLCNTFVGSATAYLQKISKE